jgi:hypothetical protein
VQLLGQPTLAAGLQKFERTGGRFRSTSRALCGTWSLQLPFCAALERWAGEACASRITLRLEDGRTRTPGLDWSDPDLDFDAGRAGMTVSFRARFSGEAGGIQAVSLRLASEEDATDALRALRSLRLACAAVR